MRLLSLLLVAALVPCTAHTAILLVPTDYPTIQDALNATMPGDEVVIEPGFYSEILTPRDVSFTIRSQSGDPTNTTLVRSRILYGGTNASAYAIEGLTFQDTDFNLCVAQSNPAASLTVDNCRFVNNNTTLSGCLTGIGLFVSNTLFEDNTSEESGGAIYFINGTGSANDCVFRRNRMTDDGIVTEGGAIYAGTPVTISGNLFEDNEATNSGGGAIVFAGATDGSVVSGNTFLRNSGFQGGAIHIVSALAGHTIEDNVFIDNEGTFGATFRALTGSATMRRNTIVGSLGGGAAVDVFGAANMLFEKNILAFGDGVGFEWDSTGIGTLNCNDIFGNAGGSVLGTPTMSTNNFSLDPLFCDYAASNLTLGANSPCLPPNNVCLMLIGALGQGCGTVPVEDTTWGGVKARFDTTDCSSGLINPNCLGHASENRAERTL